jgi:prevent-host-death family protein
MVSQVNVSEAKARLSELIHAATQGEDVVIARAGRPVVRLVPIVEPDPRRLGFVKLTIDDAFFEPLDDDEIEDWE